MLPDSLVACAYGITHAERALFAGSMDTAARFGGVGNEWSLSDNSTAAQ
jgi:hypothetical protein